MSNGWFRESKRHSLARRGITSRKTPIKTPLHGGIAEYRKPADFNPSDLDKGIDIEMEHTDDPEIAARIAMDHLEEYPEYYKYLPKMERKLEKRELRQAKRIQKKRDKKKKKKQRR